MCFAGGRSQPPLLPWMQETPNTAPSTFGWPERALIKVGPMAPPLPLYPLPIDPSLRLHRCWCLECVPLRRRVVHALGDTGRRREASGRVAGEREECAECTRR